MCRRLSVASERRMKHLQTHFPSHGEQAADHQAQSNASTLALVGTRECLHIVFPDQSTRPSIRFFRELLRKRLVPSKKIGRRTFLDPLEVRRAIDERFSVASTHQSEGRGATKGGAQ